MKLSCILVHWTQVTIKHIFLQLTFQIILYFCNNTSQVIIAHSPLLHECIWNPWRSQNSKLSFPKCQITFLNHLDTVLPLPRNHFQADNIL